MRTGFDNDKYIELQAEHIRERVGQFGGKLYLEFGGKLFDDYHASRVLPGFEPDSKFRMLKSIADDVEVIIAINANHIEKNKSRGDLGITYDEDVLRLVDLFRGNGMAVAAVVITQYAGPRPTPSATVWRAWASSAACTTPSRATPTTWTSSSPTRATARTSTWRPPVRSWWLRPPVPAPASSPPASRRSTTSTSAA